MELSHSEEDSLHQKAKSEIEKKCEFIASQNLPCTEVEEEACIAERQNDKGIAVTQEISINDSDVEADPLTENVSELKNFSPRKETIDSLKECVVDLSSSMLKVDNMSPERTENVKEVKQDKQYYVKHSKKLSKCRSSTPRRSVRTRNKHKLYLESNSDSEIEEIKIEDPLCVPQRNKEKQKLRSHRNNTIVVKDTKRLAELASGSKSVPGGRKEPTLIIIDTQSILSGKGPVPLAQAYTSSNTNSAPGYSVIPISLPTKGLLLPLRLNNTQPTGISSEVVPIQCDPLSTQHSPPSITNILPNISDDMHIVDAPSFIVPYLYLKPPVESLKEYIDKIKMELEKKKVDGSLERNNEFLNNSDNCSSKPEASGRNDMCKSVQGDNGAVSENCKSLSDSDTPEKKRSKESDRNGGEEMNNTGNSEDSKCLREEEKEAVSKNLSDDKNNNEKCDQTSDQYSSENKIYETKKSKSSISPHDKKDKNSINLQEAIKYFDTPLGQFFIKIGMNLVEEYVQTDALRLQKRKRDREDSPQNTSDDVLINSIVKNLEITKEINETFHHEQKKCEYCSFKTESSLVMAQHLETPHMRNYIYKCNFCSLQIRSPHDILFHMESEHSVRGRLERAPALHQCVNCTFEDSQKSKLNRHILVCLKKYKAERNLEPPLDWAPPAKILRSTPKRPILGFGKSKKTVNSLPKLAPGPARSKLEECLTRGRGRPVLPGPFYPHDNKLFPRPLSSSSVLETFSRAPSSQQPLLLPMPYQVTSSTVCQPTSSTTSKFLSKNPHVSITALPKVPLTTSAQGSPKTKSTERGAASSNTQTSFVVCEVCDGYIKDLEQLRNHMQWIHKVKIHPKMIHNRPPLNCQKCQSRFFTDQGLERHLLGTHGLVTSSIQEASNSGQDSGRCPICGRVYSSRLLNHVSKDHNLALRPAHLSYKCTVCTATFEMYKDFEHHVYSVHSSVAKRAAAAKNETQITRALANKESTLMQPLKINDEVTVIPHMASSHSSVPTVNLEHTKSSRRRVRKKPIPRKILPSKDVQVIDLGDSPEEINTSENDKDDEDSEDEISKRVTKQSKKVSKDSLGKDTRKVKLDTPKKRSKIVSEEEKINLESEESLQILKQLCKNVAENKMDDDNEDSLEILEELYKNVSHERDYPEANENLEIIKQLCKDVNEDGEHEDNAEALWENIKDIRGKVDGGSVSDAKEEDEQSEVQEVTSKNDCMDTPKKRSSTGIEDLLGENKEDTNFEIRKRAKKGKSPRKNLDSSHSSVQSDD